MLERLDPAPLRNLCLRYQHHLTAAANLVATEQNQLTQRVREVSFLINQSMCPGRPVVEHKNFRLVREGKEQTDINDS